MTSFDKDNVFARIIRGEIPSHKVYEDEVVFAMMDIMPQAEGHVLVLPKQGSRNLLDADPDVLSETIKRVQMLAGAVMKAMGADGFQIAQANEPAAAQTVFHLHFHIIPAYLGVPLKRHAAEGADHAKLAEQAKKIAAVL
ncbi:MAG: HIT family protein [Alphaproteobacteria bacterium]|nr:HIT family protein [Alphaproteobacteria bacterium]